MLMMPCSSFSYSNTRGVTYLTEDFRHYDAFFTISEYECLEAKLFICMF
jgi:hypothetical protein